MAEEDDIWTRFLGKRVAEAATRAELERVRTDRSPLEHRTPSVALFEGLVLYHQGYLTREELEQSVDENEALDRELEAQERRAKLRLVRPDH